MHYVESGAGPPLLLLHAFPVDARMWDCVRAELEEQFRVITPDQRGLGRSPLDGSSAPDLAQETLRRRVAEEPDLDLVAADVLALLDRLDIRRVHLGGCSMGGYVAMAVLRAAPERVAGLVLADTKAAADNTEQRENRLAVADRAEREGTAGWLADNSIPGVLGSTTRQDKPEVVDRVRHMIDRQPADGVAWAQRAMAARPDSTATLRSYAGPALVLVGADDALTPPETARDLTAMLPGGELRQLPAAGHLAAAESPASFAREVLDWLDRVRPD